MCLRPGKNWGLVAAAAIILLALASNWETVERRLPLSPITLIVIGLLVAFLSGLPSMFGGQAFMTSLWRPFFELPLLGKVKRGTPFLFDVGVYFAVIGFTLKCAIALGTSDEAES